MSDCSHSCGGRCCRGFVIHTHTSAQLAERYADASARIAAHEETPNDWDIVAVHEMLVETGEVTGDDRPVYTCRNLDTASGLCTIYDKRPEMCRRFPYPGVPCSWCGFVNPEDSINEPVLAAG